MDEIRDALPKPLSARFARERPLPGVNASVILQRGQFFKGPAALVASVRLLRRVVQHVLVVRLLEREGFVALRAAVRHFSWKKSS